MPKKTPLGLGTDIESTRRFRKLDRKKDRHFLSKIFTKDELDYCFARKNAPQHLAARYAAKEAVTKACCSSGIRPPSYAQVEIFKNADGAPEARIRGLRRKLRVRISMSHTKEIAIAVAVVLP